jgi:autotransporter passenger strand-loop-strand repeat protein
MTITVSSGVTSKGLTISSGDPLVVLSGGTVSASTIRSGGSATLSFGATGDDLTVSKGGVLMGQGDLDGDDGIAGSVSGVTLAGNAFVGLSAGGAAHGVTVSGILQVDSGATATGTTAAGVSMGAGNLEVYGSAADGIIESTETVEPGGVVSGDIVKDGGSLFLRPGATAIDETVESGGSLEFEGTLSSSFYTDTPLAHAALFDGVTVSSGASIDFAAVTVLGGVTLDLGSGSIADDITVSRGGILLGAGPELYGTNDVAGSISGVAVSDSGLLELTSGGSASGVTVFFGTELKVDAGGSATGTILAPGIDEGEADLRVSGAESGAAIGSDDAEVIYAGGKASGDTVQRYGREVVSSGAVASGATVSSGGVSYILSGGKGISASVAGQQILAAGGVASATTLLSGGQEIVASGGAAFRATVSSGGSETISSGGVLSGLDLLGGGVLVDRGKVRYAGSGTLAGTLSGTGDIVEGASGVLLVSGVGAAFGGRAVIEGGTVELATAGALGTGRVDFVAPTTGSAVLQIDAADAPAAGGTFANVISNFDAANEDIDLRSIAYVAGASAKVVGATLVLTDGGKTYTFDIAGGTAGAYPVLSDGHGGTLIDPIPAATHAALDPKALGFTHAAAAFAPSDAANAALVSSTSPARQTPFLHAAAPGVTRLL